MKMKEVIALALAGYKKKDIEDLLAMDIEEETQENNVEEKPEQTEPENVEEVAEEEEIDYKSLYEDTLAKLKNAQKSNTKENINSGETPDEDILANLVKDFM